MDLKTIVILGLGIVLTLSAVVATTLIFLDMRASAGFDGFTNRWLERIGITALGGKERLQYVLIALVCILLVTVMTLLYIWFV